MILLGNTYPLNLIRRTVEIAPAPLSELQERAKSEGFLSFWGHDNTRAIVTEILGFDPVPLQHRPALTLSPDYFPMLENHLFHEVWILSPDYAPGIRPSPNIEVNPSDILNWQVLRLNFQPTP